ncbi:hypothetical protein [Roseburia faecis]|uniref:hypothetical protein n=1 Tax=Roseburia faecis TaxID=301302 RepID=UPI003F9B514E
MRKDIYKSKRTKRTEIISWALIVVVVALLSPFIYRKVLVRDSVTEYKELLVITKGKAKKADSGYNQKKRYYSGASKTTTMYYVRVNASDLDCGEETMDVEVSSSIYDNVVEGEYHEFTVVTDTLITGKKRVRIYY